MLQETRCNSETITSCDYTSFQHAFLLFLLKNLLYLLSLSLIVMLHLLFITFLLFYYFPSFMKMLYQKKANWYAFNLFKINITQNNPFLSSLRKIATRLSRVWQNPPQPHFRTSTTKKDLPPSSVPTEVGQFYWTSLGSSRGENQNFRTLIPTRTKTKAPRSPLPPLHTGFSLSHAHPCNISNTHRTEHLSQDQINADLCCQQKRMFRTQIHVGKSSEWFSSSSLLSNTEKGMW